MPRCVIVVDGRAASTTSAPRRSSARSCGTRRARSTARACRPPARSWPRSPGHASAARSTTAASTSARWRSSIEAVSMRCSVRRQISSKTSPRPAAGVGRARTCAAAPAPSRDRVAVLVERHHHLARMQVQRRPAAARGGAVDRVADDRPSHRRAVHAQLMGAPGMGSSASQVRY